MTENKNEGQKLDSWQGGTQAKHNADNRNEFVDIGGDLTLGSANKNSAQGDHNVDREESRGATPRPRPNDQK
jgi:hypothetical protein